MKKKLKKYLIPHEENDHQPHFLRNKSLKYILGFTVAVEVIALLLITPTIPLSIKNAISNLSLVFPSVLVEKANETRLDKNQTELVVNERLVAAAQLKANDMAQKGYFAHTSPEGRTPWYFIGQAGYSYSNAGENLAVNFVDSIDVHRAWLNSPTHRDNILRGSFREIGIATAEGRYKGKDAIFVVQYFGTPQLQSPTPFVSTVEAQVIEEENEEVLGASVETKEEVLGVDLSGNVVENSEEIKRELAQADTQPSNSELVSESPLELSFFEKVKSSPRFLTTLALTVAGLAVLFAVLLKIFIKPKIQYPPMILNGLFLVLIIVIFALANDVVVAHFAEVL